MAGESAREVARWRRERGKRLLAQAEAFERGAQGEEATAAALTMLPPGEWTVFHDVRWPGRRLANIDHVAVGPGGVFVIDSKNWQGRVEVRDGVLRQNGFRREREVAAAADAALAVAGLVRGLDPRFVQPVICLVGQPPVSAYAREVLVCSSANVAIALQTHQVVLDARGVRSTVGWLHLALRAAARPPAVPHRQRPAVAAHPAPRRPGGPARRGRSAAALAGGMARLVLALLGALVMAGLVGTVFSHVPRSGASTHAPITDSSPDLGTSVRLPRATNRPPLSVTVEGVRTVKASPGAPYLVPGNRWAAARVVVHNDGRRSWRSQPGTSWSVTDADGGPHQAHGQVAIGAGPTLPDVVRLPPGRSERGWVVFQVPLSVPLVRATVTVGPGAPATASWVVDRQ